MKKYIAFGLLLFAVGIQNIGAQQMLCLDSCRAMALRNNKQMGVSQLKQEVAANLRKSARTKYLPHVGALGGSVVHYHKRVDLPLHYHPRASVGFTCHDCQRLASSQRLALIDGRSYRYRRGYFIGRPLGSA